MDYQEAKSLLQVCRPGNAEDLNDPLMAEALEFAESDSELMAWFEAEQDFDRQMCDEFETIPTPPDLKASILSGMRAHHAAAQNKTSEVEPTVPFTENAATEQPAEATTSRSWWARPSIGIAAAIAVLLAISVLPRTPTSNQIATNSTNTTAVAGVPNIIQFLSEQIDGMPQRGFEKVGNEVTPLKTFLASKGAPTPNSMPKTLEEMPVMGCVTFDYEGSKISMICFKEKKVCHLITVNRNAINENFPPQPQHYQHGNHAFKVWEDGEKIMIMSVKGTKQDIPEFI